MSDMLFDVLSWCAERPLSSLAERGKPRVPTGVSFCHGLLSQSMFVS